MKKILCCILLLSLLTGCASKTDRSLFAVLLEDPQSYALIESAQQIRPAQVQNDSLRLTVAAAYGDGYTAQLLLLLESTDGSSLEGVLADLRPDAVFDFYPLNQPVNQNRPAGAATERLAALSDAAHTYYVATIRSRVPFSEVNLSLGGLYQADGAFEALSEPLSCRFSLTPCRSLSYEYLPGIVKKIVLSPMGLSIDIFEPNGGVVGEETPRHEIVLELANGTLISTEDFPAKQSSNGTMDFIRVDFYPYLNIDTVACVRIDDIAYTLHE